jgi:hypothetical protein
MMPVILRITPIAPTTSKIIPIIRRILPPAEIALRIISVLSSNSYDPITAPGQPTLMIRGKFDRIEGSPLRGDKDRRRDRSKAMGERGAPACVGERA